MTFFACHPLLRLQFNRLLKRREISRDATEMNDLVQLTRSHGDIAVITINNPPVNALSPGVPEGISEAIDQIVKDEMVKAAVVIGAGRTFVAGADIKEFEKMTSRPGQRGPGLLPLLLKIENCSKPVVMAIHGTALGGGLELAMAGHYRVAAPNAKSVRRKSNLVLSQEPAALNVCHVWQASRKRFRCAPRAIPSKRKKR